MARVGVEGLTELRRALRGADDDLREEFKRERHDVHVRVARRTVESWPRITGRMAGKVKARAASTAVNHPGAGPVDFGGWPRGREFRPKGRYLFVAAKAEAPVFERDLRKLLDRVHERKKLN